MTEVKEKIFETLATKHDCIVSCRQLETHEGTGSHTGEAGGRTQDRGTGVTQDENRKTAGKHRVKNKVSNETQVL